MAQKVQVKDVYFGRRGFLTDTEYNREMEEWSRATQKLSKAQAALFTKGKKRNRVYKTGKKAGKSESKLRNSIQYQLKSDAGEVAGVAFQFPVHGIFREYGVGRGTPRNMVGHTSRSMSDWLSGSLNKQEDKLLAIVAEHESDKYIRVFMGVKK